MNITAVIIASVFVVVALAAFVFFLLGKAKFVVKRTANYYKATSGVYLSAAILLLVLSLTMAELPSTFIVIAEIMIAVVFVFSTYMLYRIAQQINEIQKDIEDGKVRSSEQVAREDEEFARKLQDDEETEAGEKDN